MREARVRLAPKKDVDFHGNIAQLIGKKHSMGLDKKSLAYLLRAIRQHTRMTFEGTLTEAKVLTLPNGIKLKIDITLLEIKVRPNFTRMDSRPKNTISLPDSAATALQQTADNMDEGALKVALEKLAKRKI